MGVGNDKPKIFDDFVIVECEQCERWWLNQCDGCKDTLKGSKTPCNAFVATRSVIIPQEIERLKKAIKGLKTTVLLLGVAVLLLAIGQVVLLL